MPFWSINIVASGFYSVCQTIRGEVMRCDYGGEKSIATRISIGYASFRERCHVMGMIDEVDCGFETRQIEWQGWRGYPEREVADGAKW